jgi:hypothetical protein
MPARIESRIITKIKKHKEEYDSGFGPSGEVRFGENFSNMDITDKYHADFSTEKKAIEL